MCVLVFEWCVPLEPERRPWEGQRGGCRTCVRILPGFHLGTDTQVRDDPPRGTWPSGFLHAQSWLSRSSNALVTRVTVPSEGLSSSENSGARHALFESQPCLLQLGEHRLRVELPFASLAPSVRWA